MTIPSPCHFCYQFYGQMAQNCTGVYRGDRLCYCPYGCGRLYTKAYMYRIRAFLPQSEENHNRNSNIRNRHSIPPPLREGTPLPPFLGRDSENGLNFPKSRRSSLLSGFLPQTSNRKYHELENHPPTQQYFGIDNGEMMSPLQFPTADDFELNMEQFSFDDIPIGAMDDPYATQDNDELPLQSRLHSGRINMERNNTFGPTTSNEPGPTATNGENSHGTDSSTAVAPPASQKHDSVSLTATNAPDCATETILLLKEMRSVRQLLQIESKALMKMSKHHKKHLAELDRCTKQYVHNVEYIQQIKYDLEKVKQDVEDRYLEAMDIRDRQNELIDQYYLDKKKYEFRQLKNWCKRIFSLSH